MLAKRPLVSQPTLQSAEPARYFGHRAAMSQTVEMMVGPELNVLWSNAAALALTARRGPLSLNDNRLILPQRRQEDSLRAFLISLGQGSGIWVLEADEPWLVRAETIAPADAPPAWLLTWQAMDHADRYLWADIESHLKLTRSETRILRYLLAGQSVEQTAAQLVISVQTARTHVRRIYAKLGVGNREQLFALVLPYRWG